MELACAGCPNKKPPRPRTAAGVARSGAAPSSAKATLRPRARGRARARPPPQPRESWARATRARTHGGHWQRQWQWQWQWHCWCRHCWQCMRRESARARGSWHRPQLAPACACGGGDPYAMWTGPQQAWHHQPRPCTMAAVALIFVNLQKMIGPKNASQQLLRSTRIPVHGTRTAR